MKIAFLLISCLHLIYSLKLVQQNYYLNKIRGGSIGESSRTLLITSNYPIKYLNRRISMKVKNSLNISDIKKLISSKYPGNPPESLQSIFYGLKELENKQTVNDISNLTVIPLQLDLISGTNVYSQFRNVREAIEAYVAIQIHLSSLSERISSLLSSSSSDNQQNNNETATADSDDEKKNQKQKKDTPQQIKYLKLFNELNQTIFEKYSEMIEKALKEEQNSSIQTPSIPETTTGSVDEYLKQKSPTSLFLARQFNLNQPIMKSLLFYSLVWIVSVVLFVCLFV